MFPRKLHYFGTYCKLEIRIFKILVLEALCNPQNLSRSPSCHRKKKKKTECLKKAWSFKLSHWEAPKVNVISSKGVVPKGVIANVFFFFLEEESRSLLRRNLSLKLPSSAKTALFRIDYPFAQTVLLIPGEN